MVANKAEVMGSSFCVGGYLTLLPAMVTGWDAKPVLQRAAANLRSRGEQIQGIPLLPSTYPVDGDVISFSL